MECEGILLTGGASRRMGTDKAKLRVDGVALGYRTALALTEAGIAVTVLGNEPIAGFAFQADAERHRGPLEAVRAFTPAARLVFLAACDMPRFDARIVEILRDRIRGHDAAIPSLDGRLQPLCGLYTRQAVLRLREPELADARAVMEWVEELDVATVDENALRQLGFPATALRGANTPDQLGQS